MTNPLYQAAIRELEQLLSPRVVSRLLKEGLREQDRTPETVGLEDVVAILKGPVFRQLQVSLPAAEAKGEITAVTARLTAFVEGPAPTAEDADDDASGATESRADASDGAAATSSADRKALRRQEEELVGLRAALKPFNLYFEWSEVQKLRAQVQLLEDEHSQQHEATELVAEAHRQLATVRQKLEDQLVIQARDLTELDEAFERVQTVGGVKVRRLENLVEHIHEAQEARQLAPAEVDRARKLANDLRKLVESAVYSEDADAFESEQRVDPNVANLSPEVTDRLDQLDRDAATRDLEKVREDFSNLLDHLPELAERLEAVQAALQRGEHPGAAVDDLRETFREAAERHRTALRAEFAHIADQARELPVAVSTTELLQAITVADGVLETTLPSSEDTDYIRRLQRLALEKRDEWIRTEEETQTLRSSALAQQKELLERGRRAVERYEAVLDDAEPVDHLRESLTALDVADREDRLAPDLTTAVRRAEERLEAAVAEGADDPRLRTRAELRSLRTKVEGLPDLDVFAARAAGVHRELDRLLDADGEADVDPVQVDAVRSLVSALRRDAIDTCRTRLDQLARRASEVHAEELLGRIQSANNVLDDDVYPDIRSLEAAVRQQREAHREAQYGDLHALEREAAELLETAVEASERLHTFLQRARDQLEAGDVASDLQRGWALLEETRAAVERRLAEFEPRLDAALAAFKGVAMLNSEDVATVRRILKHLDSQRSAFPRISVGLRIQLVHSLEQAENLLSKLQEEVEATRAIADKLMSGGVLDDVLGLFGEPAAAAGPTAEPPSGESVEAWLTSFTKEAGVRGGAVLGAQGWLAGTLEVDAEDVRQRLAPLEDALSGLGGEVGSGPAQLTTIEQNGDVLIVAPLGEGNHLLLHLDTPTVLSLVGHRLRTELADLKRRLRDPSNA